MKDILNIYLISSDWEYSHRKGFIRNMKNALGKILVVEYPVSFTVNLIIKFKKRLLGYITGRFKSRMLETGIEIFTPFMIFHKLFWIKCKLLAMIDSWLIAYQINKYIRKNYSESVINFWIYLPVDYYLTKFVKYDNLIYDYYDNQECDNNGNIIKENYELNIKLAPKCDLINCVSEFTYKKMLEIGGNAIKNVNGYDPAIFIRNFKDTVTELDILQKPIIGYSGVLRNWIDISMLTNILEKTDFYLVCIGYVDRTFNKEYDILKQYSNFIHIEYKPIEQLPDFISRFRVGILPYKINRLTESVFPLKFFEYMALKIPIVSSPLPELKKYDKIIGYSFNSDEFVDSCIKAVNGFFNENIKDYDRILSENSWDKVFDRIKINLYKVYEEKGII